MNKTQLICHADDVYQVSFRNRFRPTFDTVYEVVYVYQSKVQLFQFQTNRMYRILHSNDHFQGYHQLESRRNQQLELS